MSVENSLSFLFGFMNFTLVTGAKKHNKEQLPIFKKIKNIQQQLQQ